MALEIEPVVTVAALRGGDVVVTGSYSSVTEQWETVKRVCTSIGEVVTHSIRTLELVDQWPARAYERIEKASQ